MRQTNKNFREFCYLCFKCLTSVNDLFPFFSHCEPAVLCPITLPKTTLIFRKKFIHKQGYLLPKKLFRYFRTIRAIVLHRASLAFSKRGCYSSLLNPFLGQYSHFIPLKNTRKRKVFWSSQGV